MTSDLTLPQKSVLLKLLSGAQPAGTEKIAAKALVRLGFATEAMSGGKLVVRLTGRGVRLAKALAASIAAEHSADAAMGEVIR